MLFRQISRAVQQMSRVGNLLQDFVNCQSGKINIGASELTMRYYLLPYLESFRRQYPNVNLQIHAFSTPLSLSALNAGTIDFANIEVNSNDLIPPTVLHNLGIGFVPYKFARSFLLNYGLIQLSLDIVIPKREICIVQNPSHPLSPAAKTLLDMMITGNEYTEEQYSMENEHFHGDAI